MRMDKYLSYASLYKLIYRLKLCISFMIYIVSVSYPRDENKFTYYKFSMVIL